MMKAIRAILNITLVLAFVNISYGKIVFTEIMLQLKSATDPTTQWFEVYNTKNTVVALKGYQFRLCTGNCQDVPITFVVNVSAYGHVVFGNNGNMDTNGGVSLFQLNFTALPKDGSGKNAFYIRLPGLPIFYDKILNWSTDSDATSFYAKLPFAAGATVAKVIVDTTGQDTANWKTSTTSISCEKGGDKGTPGKLNTYLCPTKPSTKAPTTIPTKASSRSPTKNPTVTPTRLLTTKQPTKPPTSPLAPADSPTGVKPTTGRKRCGLLGLSFVCFNGCGMFGRLLNICQQ
jgi:hypothetical protein